MSDKPRKPRSDSVQRALEVFKHAKHDLQPSSKLNAEEMAYFEFILSDREASSWSPNHLVVATQLAQTYYEIDQLRKTLRAEGMMTVNPRGTPIPHPAISSINMMTSTAQGLNRLMGLSASQKGIGVVSDEKSTTAFKDAENVKKQIENDDLLAS